MTYNQKSLRWHRRRAYATSSIAHAEQALKSGNNNEFVIDMHKANVKLHKETLNEKDS